MRVLVVAHGHPDFSVGGAEIAAYHIYQSMKLRADVEEAVFLARTDQDSVSHGAIMLRRPDEYLWRQDIADWFRLSSRNLTSVMTTFREFLLLKKPDVVYVHHFVHLGIEVLREIRRTLPDCKLILTLHEFVAICNRNGQMVKNGTKRLCYRESVEDCHACFPERSPQDFWLRKHYLQRHFEAVDMFVSPSEFLRQRFIAWGIPPEMIVVIENGQPASEAAPLPNVTQRANRFGFFGQVTEYKGVDILLQALHLVAPDVRAKISVEIHGANLEFQGEWFREHIENLRAPLIKSGVLRWVGGYEQGELKRRMSKVDWVVVPSIWWENSPLVIQEAFLNAKPVICSGIGGMAEKVRNEVDGLHFEVRNPFDLAEVLTRAAGDQNLHRTLQSNIRRSLTHEQCATEYLRMASFSD